MVLHFFKGFVIKTPGYPEEVVVECIEPEGYPDTWDYKIWQNGRWRGMDQIEGCLNPNLCYDDPPALPGDFSVENNQTLDKPNSANTTLTYKCSRKCEYTCCYLAQSFMVY